MKITFIYNWQMKCLVMFGIRRIYVLIAGMVSKVVPHALGDNVQVVKKV